MVLKDLPFASARLIPHTSFSGSEKIICFSGGALLIQANMDIDADGSPNALTLDPDHGQLETSFNFAGILGQGKYLDSENVPYFVLPQDFAISQGLVLGDIAAVIYRGQVAFAIYGDTGPANKLGEGSIKLAELLGHAPWQQWNNGESLSTNGSINTREVFYLVFPKSKPDTLTPETICETIEQTGAQWFKAIGGIIPGMME